MKKDQTTVLKGERITLRLLQKSDFETYYTTGFSHEDKALMRLTGNERNFTKKEIHDYVERVCDDETRYDFLITQQDTILGEIVLNQIEWDSKNASFRIAMFQSVTCNQGYGSEAISLLLPFAFNTLNLHRIELEVFAYNPRAKHTYEKFGFQLEGTLREALYFEESYHDIYIMSILRSDFNKQK